MSKSQKIFEDKALEHLLDKDSSWQNHWEWFYKQIQYVYRTCEWFRRQDIGCHTILNRKMLHDVPETCEKVFERQPKGVLHRIVTDNEKWVYYDNPRAENHEDMLDTYVRRRLNRVSAVLRSFSVFGWCSIRAVAFGCKF